MSEKNKEQSCDNCDSRNGVLCFTFKKLVFNFKNSGQDCHGWVSEKDEIVAKSA